MCEKGVISRNEGKHGLLQALLIIIDYVNCPNLVLLQVKYWITFNEPLTFTGGYESSNAHAPAIDAQGYGRYLAAHTLIKAHARTYHLYDDEFRADQQGKCKY